jgi:hypothetical protein
MKRNLTTTLAAATDEVSAAEKGLASALRQIRVKPRAEKTAISEALEDALARLKVARKTLLELQRRGIE